MFFEFIWSSMSPRSFIFIYLHLHIWICYSSTTLVHSTRVATLVLQNSKSAATLARTNFHFHPTLHAFTLTLTQGKLIRVRILRQGLVSMRVVQVQRSPDCWLISLPLRWLRGIRCSHLPSPSLSFHFAGGLYTANSRQAKEFSSALWQKTSGLRTHPIGCPKATRYIQDTPGVASFNALTMSSTANNGEPSTSGKISLALGGGVASSAWKSRDALLRDRSQLICFLLSSLLLLHSTSTRYKSPLLIEYLLRRQLCWCYYYYYYYYYRDGTSTLD